MEIKIDHSLNDRYHLTWIENLKRLMLFVFYLKYKVKNKNVSSHEFET